jgi:hypothetical protein
MALLSCWKTLPGHGIPAAVFEINLSKKLTVAWIFFDFARGSKRDSVILLMLNVCFA